MNLKQSVHEWYALYTIIGNEKENTKTPSKRKNRMLPPSE